jgi:hypothetical protein
LAVFRYAARTALVGAAIVAAVLSPAASAAVPPSTVRLVSITTSGSSVDVPPLKASVGDRELSTSRLVNAGARFGQPKGAVIGSDRSTMTLLSATSARLKVVAKLPGGTITANGRLMASGGGAVSVAVVTGTGVFAGARGTLTILKPTGPKTVVNIYRLSYAPIA